jgi:hypothetical protein
MQCVNWQIFLETFIWMSLIDLSFSFRLCVFLGGGGPGDPCVIIVLFFFFICADSAIGLWLLGFAHK